MIRCAEGHCGPPNSVPVVFWLGYLRTLALTLPITDAGALPYFTADWDSLMAQHVFVRPRPTQKRYQKTSTFGNPYGHVQILVELRAMTILTSKWHRRYHERTRWDSMMCMGNYRRIGQLISAANQSFTLLCFCAFSPHCNTSSYLA